MQSERGGTTRRWILCAAVAALFPGRAWAHVESTLFLEHPPKTAFGVFSKTSWLDASGDRSAFALVPFAEVAPSSRYSFGVGLPGGRFDGDDLLSDMVLAAKGFFKYRGYPVIPVLSLEIPTGEGVATSGHTEAVAAVFSERMTPRYHLYGSVGGRTSFAGHGEERINVFAPHGDDEVFGSLGLTWWLHQEPKFGLDGRVTPYFEEFEKVAPELQFGIVFQKKVRQAVVKASLDAFVVTNGVREGSGVGFSFYVAP